MAVEVPMTKASPLAIASEAIARRPVLVAVWGCPCFTQVQLRGSEVDVRGKGVCG